MSCHVHDLKWVAVWINGQHCFMLKRCSSCLKFDARTCVYTGNEPFQNSTNISVDKVPADKLQELKTFVSRIPAEKPEQKSVSTFSFATE